MKFLKKMTDLDNAIIATDEEIRYIKKIQINLIILHMNYKKGHQN